jgi:hypothetical protein
MANTMRAAVVHAFRAPLRIEEVPIPVPGPGEVLIKVVATGVCHTDLPITAVGRKKRLRSIVFAFVANLRIRPTVDSCAAHRRPVSRGPSPRLNCCPPLQLIRTTGCRPAGGCCCSSPTSNSAGRRSCTNRYSRSRTNRDDGGDSASFAPARVSRLSPAPAISM